MEKELIILITWHHETDKRKIECFEENRRTIVEFNPGVEVITIMSPFQDNGIAWSSPDLTVFVWFQENKDKVQSKRFLILEWDCWCDMNLKEYFSKVWDLDVVASCVLYPERDSWHWFRTLYKMPFRSRLYATGVLPFCGILVSNRAMRAIGKEIVKPEYEGVISELRFATIATMLGFDPVPTPVCSRTITWKSSIPFNFNHKGLHHPRKVLTSDNALIDIVNFLPTRFDILPKIIHQTWNDSPTPKYFDELTNSWKANHPDWDYILWTDEMNREFIRQFFPAFLLQYDSYEDKIQRVDVVKYFILYKLGGVFLDLDFRCLKNIGPLLDGAECAFGIEPIQHCEQYQREMIISNAFMASKPNNNFFKTICDSLPSYAWKEAPFVEYILSTTGSIALTEIYEKYELKSSITILPSNTIYPLTAKEAELERNQQTNEIIEAKVRDAYALHYFIGSWYQDIF